MRAALIGFGMIGPMHAAAIEASETVDLAGVYVRDPSKVEGVPLFASVEAIASDPSVDFAVLLTPPSARLDIVKTLADAGKPILMEKPIDRTLEGAKAVVAASTSVPTGVVFQHRFRDVAVKLGALIREGSLGDVAMTEVIVPWWRDQSYYDEPGRGTYAQDGGGVLITQAIHILDLVVSLLGPVARVQAIARTTALHRMEAEDFVAGGLDFESGVVGSFSATTASFASGSEIIRVHGTLASAELTRNVLKVKWRDGREEVFGQTAGDGRASPAIPKHAWHQAAIEDFAVSLRDKRPARVTACDALHGHALIEALIQSSAEKRAIEVAPT